MGLVLQNNIKKRIGLFSAIALGVSSIIGSGWLFAPYRSAMVAGPAAIISWIIGAIIIILLGLCFAEIATLYPRRGLSAIIPTLSHNVYFGFPFAISNWLGVIAVVSLEADATVQYLIHLFPKLEHFLYYHNQLTGLGDALAIALIFIFSLVNYWGTKSLIKTNNIFSVLKVIIPVIIGIVLLMHAFHPKNFDNINHTFIPYGAQSILTAILTTGIIVAFNGFQAVISFASEIKKPYRTIPLSIIFAILICLCVYLLVQVAFIGAIPQQLITGGWLALQLNAPFVQVLSLIGMSMFSILIYFGAAVTPSGTAIAFTGAATRMFTAMSIKKQMPSYFNYLHPVYRISRRSLFINTFIASLFLLLFRSWGSIAQVLSLLHVISYLPVPIALCVLRNKISRKKYLFRVPCGQVLAIFLFTFFTYLCTLANLKTLTEIMVIFIVFMTVFITVSISSIEEIPSIFKQTWSLILYFTVLYILTMLSPSHSHYFSDKDFLILVVLISSLMFYLLLKTSRNDVEIIDSSVRIYQNNEEAKTFQPSSIMPKEAQNEAI